MRYAVVIEKANGNYSAYVPDLPGCVATGDTVKAVENEIRAAIRFHIEGLKAEGLEIPAPTSIADYVEAQEFSETCRARAPEDVITHGAELLGTEPPPEVPFEEADLTPMARSFYGDSRRISNVLIKSELGVRLAYPNYRAGLKALADPAR